MLSSLLAYSKSGFSGPDLNVKIVTLTMIFYTSYLQSSSKKRKSGGNKSSRSKRRGSLPVAEGSTSRRHS